MNKKQRKHGIPHEPLYVMLVFDKLRK